MTDGLEFSRNELKVLWYLKRRGGVMTRDGYGKSIVDLIAQDMDMRYTSVQYILKVLESKSLVLRTYEKGKSKDFSDAKGFNPMIRLELVDTGMYLPPLPAPMPLAAVVSKENEDLEERVVHKKARELTAEEIIDALCVRNDELVAQIDKLQEIVHAQAEELLKRDKKPDIGHLTERVGDRLSADTWRKLRGGS
jgi:hypothetical protein